MFVGPPSQKAVSAACSAGMRNDNGQLLSVSDTERDSYAIIDIISKSVSKID